MRVGVFGGTFDPIHRGHVDPVLGVQRRLGLGHVLFLPTATPPHKEGPRGASALQRFAMAELALLDEPDLRVATLEMENDGPSYTVDTLERLHRERPDDEHVLLLGADSFVQLPTWRTWHRILELSVLAVMVRPGWSLDGHAESLEGEQQRAIKAGRVHFIEPPPVDLSSSDIRRCMRLDEPLPKDALHPRVLAYVDKYGLYRDNLGD